MIRFDTHVHTTFSHDGQDEMSAYATRVDEGIADAVGFAEHAEFRAGSPVRGALDPGTYLQAVEGWRSRGYNFYPGVEIGWRPEDAQEIRAYLARHPFAFVIGSVHTLPSAAISGRIPTFTEESVFDRVVSEYGEAIASSLAVDEFDVVGHPGVFLRHLSPEFSQSPRWRARIRDLEESMAVAIARSGKLLEVNTSGMFSARGEPCAGRFLLERYRASGGRTITLGSDAHRAVDLGRGLPEALGLVQTLGFDRIFLPWDPGHPVRLEN